MCYHRQGNVCHCHTLPDRHDPPGLCELSPILAESPHLGTMSRSSRDGDEAQEGVRKSNDTLYPDCRLARDRPPHPAVVSKRRGCYL